MSADFEIVSLNQKSLASIMGSIGKLKSQPEPLKKQVYQIIAEPQNNEVLERPTNRFKSNSIASIISTPSMNIDVEPTISNDSNISKEPIEIFERPTRNSWVRPLVTKPVQKYHENSLAAFVISLKNKIEKKGTDPIGIILPKCFEDFQAKYRELEDEWKQMMNRMLEIIIEVDSKHFGHNYYGYGNQIKHDLSNIALSYIIIGSNAIDGHGIDQFDPTFTGHVYENYNLYLENYEQVFFSNNETVLMMIDKYLSSLDKMLVVIGEYNGSILKLDKEHDNLLIDNRTIQSELKSHKASLKKIERNIENNKKKIDVGNKFILAETERIFKLEEKVESISFDKNHNEKTLEEAILELSNAKENVLHTKAQIQEMSDSFVEFEKDIEDYKFIIQVDQNNLLASNKKIQKVIDQKDSFTRLRNQTYLEVYNKLRFNYFLHNDWFPMLDHNLLSNPKY